MLLVALAWTALTPLQSLGTDTALATARKGIIDFALEADSPILEQRKTIREVHEGLKARWARLNVSWRTIEPQRGHYDEAALAELGYTIRALDAVGVSVLLTTYETPQWASDSRFWDDPPPSYAPGYAPFYPIREDALEDYRRLARLLAQRFGSHIDALECWNEPNLWSYLYPQRTASDPHFGARAYLLMLRAFSKGVRSSDRRVRVIAGATSPIGQNDKLRSSPQAFARYLKKHGASRWFDGYSHHPYTPGGTVQRAPDGRPNNPGTTVTLGNLRVLLNIFPRQPFYLTEYGYNTKPCIYFGGFSVSEAQQARYLTSAYRLASRHRQVRALFWYLVTDVRPASGPADRGLYAGLRRADGTRKASWYAFRRLQW